MRTEPYQERTIDRDTRYVFEAGKPVFLLVGPVGKRYAMQAYAQMIDSACRTTTCRAWAPGSSC